MRSLATCVSRTDNRFVLVEQVKIPPVEEGQKAIGKDQGRPVDMNKVDEVHHAAPKTELPKDGRDDDFFGLFRMEPLQDKAAAKSEAGDKAQYGPPAGTQIEPRKVGAEERGEKTFGG